MINFQVSFQHEVLVAKLPNGLFKLHYIHQHHDRIACNQVLHFLSIISTPQIFVFFFFFGGRKSFSGIFPKHAMTKNPASKFYV